VIQRREQVTTLHVLHQQRLHVLQLATARIIWIT